MTGRRVVVATATLEGRHQTAPVVMRSPSGVTVLCERRHVIAHIATRDWVGSSWQARLAQPGFLVTCGGIR